MSNDEMRIVIAEKCGRNGWWCPQCKVIVSEYSLGYQNRHANCTDSARQSPNYPSDLNAMHEVENILVPDKFGQYLDRLREITQSENRYEVENRFELVHATARQRAIAFIKTVCPEKWKGDA